MATRSLREAPASSGAARPSRTSKTRDCRAAPSCQHATRPSSLVGGGVAGGASLSAPFPPSPRTFVAIVNPLVGVACWGIVAFEHEHRTVIRHADPLTQSTHSASPVPASPPSALTCCACHLCRASASTVTCAVHCGLASIAQDCVLAALYGHLCAHLGHHLPSGIVRLHVPTGCVEQAHTYHRMATRQGPTDLGGGTQMLGEAARDVGCHLAPRHTSPPTSAAPQPRRTARDWSAGGDGHREGTLQGKRRRRCYAAAAGGEAAG